MRIRIRGPSGQFAVTLSDDATVSDLQAQIIDKTGLTVFDVKYGFPNVKTLSLNEFESHQKLTELGVNLNGEQLIITGREGRAQDHQDTIKKEVPPPTSSTVTPPSPKLSLSRKPNESISNDPPEVPSPDHGGTFVLRIMPDDNSCLFRAVSSAVMGDMDTMTELRSIVAQTIQEKPLEYSDAVLEKPRDAYCRWIQNEDSWGGGIELSILSQHFDIEICSVDVKTLRIDRFNEGQSKRCILVYSGIHYDTIALSPSDPPFTHAYAPPEFDQKVFDAADELALDRALVLCKKLQEKHYYTDTAGFRLRCNVCGGTFIGEKGATQHAEQTGHVDFGEA
ncbi:hypothetical protein P175DRAFT_0118880 [Aspergillus ochraceoroseus IBT 24754]|uniref:Ubiquitin thioesterase OTU n=3 Tax=Aspergillus subgen. Nidulantes TaxID=2720870 RepID=A0A0F8WCR3_9EURO|nr:uncharacterized protein P175DRAFT_0118880 [Aspergillus ochraceoroseus IBT 24754]KKK15640.1 hypothetical protein ARAM_000654 [Aspergillus rambellii]KKK17205.1 hypothetical protein AOCH_000724 [Aspergillus ochraceoroseus]PTU16941.1 hypothetical protein P175DRAFT_0118880 [Aspergillus ochraceoroseus IBT 24754]